MHVVHTGGAVMAINPRDRRTTTGTTTRSRYDPRGGGAARWGAYIIGAILVAFVLLWLIGTFDDTTDTVTTPAPATTEEGTTAPVAPAAPQ
jgi:hypothetical protein